ncbi:hypothetical protein Tco_0403779, partial [Tanacetum coccineum]
VNEARDLVMSSDEASFGVTYTSISSDYEEPSDVGSPGVVVYGYDGLPMYPVDPPSPDYMPGLEEPEQASLSSDYVPGPDYIAESDPEEDSEDESEEGPANYPADRVDGDDDDDDSFDDDKVEEEASKEEEEHLALTDPIVAPVVDHFPSWGCYIYN